MKINHVRVTDNTKHSFYMDEMDQIKVVEQAMKDSNGIDSDTVQMFANVCGFAVTVLEAKAEYAKNNRVFDKYGEGSGHADVWVTITACNWNTFYIASAYLSDIWDIGGVDLDTLKQYMYIRTFKEQ